MRVAGHFGERIGQVIDFLMVDVDEFYGIEYEEFPTRWRRSRSGGGLYELGVLCPVMHMSWTRYTCGRMKSGYGYSAGVV